MHAFFLPPMIWLAVFQGLLTASANEGNDLFPGPPVWELRGDANPPPASAAGTVAESRLFRVPVAAHVPWAAIAVALNTDAAKRGDVVQFTLELRGRTLGNGENKPAVHAAVKRTVDPRVILGERDLEPGADWTPWTFAARMDRDYAPGELECVLVLGALAQEIEVRGPVAMNLGPDVDPESLPRTPRPFVDYEGSRPDAPWRAAALERIEKHRRSVARLRVIDSEGHPIAGASIDARLVRPAFPWGVQVTPSWDITGDPTRNPWRNFLRERVPVWFTQIVVDSDFKHPVWAARDAARLERTRAALEWFREKGMRVRGHPLVWPSFTFMPGLASLRDEPEALQAAILAHIEELARFGTGYVAEWDIINEARDHHEIIDIVGLDGAAEWVRTARSAAPGAVLVLNEIGLLENGPSWRRGVLDSTLTLVAALAERGAPVDALGEQAHFSRPPSIPGVLAALDRVAAAGQRLVITEYDVDFGNPEQEATFTRDFLIAIFSHPAVDGFTAWGCLDPTHWKGVGLLFDSSGAEKPTAAVWRELVLGAWRTNVNLQTDAQGHASFAGFAGDYELVLRDGDRTHRTTLTLPAPPDEDTVLIWPSP